VRSTLFKIAGLALAATMVPACGYHQKYFYVKLTNQGTVPVDATIEPAAGFGPGSEETSLSVGPGGWTQIKLSFGGLKNVRVRVYRATDHSEIFDETWTGDEVDNLNRLIEITVDPVP